MNTRTEQIESLWIRNKDTIDCMSHICSQLFTFYFYVFIYSNEQYELSV